MSYLLLQIDLSKQVAGYRAYGDVRSFIVDGMRASILKFIHIIDKKTSQGINKMNYMDYSYILYE